MVGVALEHPRSAGNGSLASCTFEADGGIPNVTMYFYPNNGY